MKTNLDLCNKYIFYCWLFVFNSDYLYCLTSIYIFMFSVGLL